MLKQRKGQKEEREEASIPWHSLPTLWKVHGISIEEELGTSVVSIPAGDMQLWHSSLYNQAQNDKGKYEMPLHETQ